MRLLFFVALFALSVAARNVRLAPPTFNGKGVSASLIRHESLLEKLAREGRYDEFRKLRTGRRAASKGNFDSSRQAIYDYADTTYVVSLGVGTPAQTFQVVPDTATSASWVVDSTCSPDGTDSCPGYCSGAWCEFMCEPICCGEELKAAKSDNQCDGKSQFKSSTSSTYLSIGTKWSSNHGRFGATGFLGNDTFSFTDGKGDWANATGVVFAQADYIEPSLGGQNVDGVLGLALGTTDNAQSVWPKLRDSNGFNDYYSIFMEKIGGASNGQQAGELRFGGTGSSCSSYYTSNTLISGSVWQFAITEWAVNDKNNVEDDLVAIIDTTASFIYGSEEMLDEIVKATSATLDEQTGLYVVNCKKTKVSYTMWNSNSDALIIKDHALVWQIEPKKCVLAFDTLENYVIADADIVLGAPFLYTYCTMFAPSGKQIYLYSPS